MAREVLRQGQMITTYGPGAMVDLPEEAVLVAGLDHWRYEAGTERVIYEPRLIEKLQRLLDRNNLSLRAPPVAKEIVAGGTRPGITVWRFPNWFVSQRVEGSGTSVRRRRLVHRSSTQNGRYQDQDRKWHELVPIRFVQTCSRGHLADIDWKSFVHGAPGSTCTRDLWFEERGTTGDLDQSWIVCECGVPSRPMSQAARLELKALGSCRGDRPWLGEGTRESCGEPARMLIRSASNAYFPQLMSVISIPDRRSAVDAAVAGAWESGLKLVTGSESLTSFRTLPAIAAALQGLDDSLVLQAIDRIRSGIEEVARPVKEVEFEALAAASDETLGDDPGGDFYARALARNSWEAPWTHGIERIVLVHRLREVVAQLGFTRLEAEGTDITGELDVDVRRAAIATDVSWLPAVEIRGEGIFLQFSAQVVGEWLQKPAVRQRADALIGGFRRWIDEHAGSKRQFPGAAYYLLHSISHLLITAISLECGYPASALKERVYALPSRGMYGVLIYTGSSDAEGTLGGLVLAGREIRRHLRRALESGMLCSNDPVCAEHDAHAGDGRSLLGAACHGCLLISETSCEQRNELLDRALVVPSVCSTGAEFFQL